MIPFYINDCQSYLFTCALSLIVILGAIFGAHLNNVYAQDTCQKVRNAYIDQHQKNIQCREQNQDFEDDLKLLNQKYQRTLVQLGKSLFKTNTLTRVSTSVPSLKMKISRKKAHFLASRSSRALSISLAKEVHGKVALFAFWATWCKPCVSPQEKAHLKTVYLFQILIMPPKSGKTRLFHLDKRAEYMGSSSLMLETDLPTLRACLRY